MHAYRTTIGRGAATFMKAKRRKRNKRNNHNARERQHGICKLYKFTPRVANQVWRANQHEHACFGLPCPWSFPSRPGILLHAVLQPLLSPQRSISPCNVPPLVPPPCAIPPSSWASLVHWSALIPKALRGVQRLRRAGIRRFRPREGHQNSPFRV